METIASPVEKGLFEADAFGQQVQLLFDRCGDFGFTPAGRPWPKPNDNFFDYFFSTA